MCLDIYLLNEDAKKDTKNYLRRIHGDLHQWADMRS